MKNQTGLNAWHLLLLPAFPGAEGYHTAVLHGSNMGNAATHSNANLPILLAGGSFKHGQHLRFDEKQSETPLSNLYLTLLHRLGVKADRFSTSSGALKGLEMA